MSLGMVSTASGMLTNQTLVQHPFRNAADGFGNAVDGSGRPRMGLGLVRDCSVCSPVRVKIGFKDNQTTNTKVTAIMRDVGPRNYGEFNEPFFCNKAVL